MLLRNSNVPTLPVCRQEYMVHTAPTVWNYSLGHSLIEVSYIAYGIGNYKTHLTTFFSFGRITD